MILKGKFMRFLKLNIKAFSPNFWVYPRNVNLEQHIVIIWAIFFTIQVVNCNDY